MKYRTYYNPEGKIVTCFAGDLSIVSFSEWEQYSYIEEPADIDKDWINNGAVCQRPENPASLNGLLISNIPIGSTLEIEGTEYPVTEVEVELELFAKRTVVTLKCFPYLDKKWEIA